MKLRDKYPSMVDMEPSTLFRKVDISTVIACLDPISAYYVEKLPLADVYNHYGTQLLDPLGVYWPHLSTDESEANINCILPSHGGADRHRSGKYYQIDRNSGEYRPSVYCFKCQAMKTSLWLAHAIERERGKDLLDTFDLIYNTWKVPHPRNIVLDFDDEVYYQVKSDSATDLVSRFNRARNIRSIKDKDLGLFLSQAAELLT